MTDDTLLPFDLPSVCRKKITVDFNGGTQSSNGGLLLLREKERTLGVCWRLANTMTDRRDPNRIRHEMFEMVMARVSAIACGYEDANDLDRLRHDPLMKLAVGRCPQSGGALASQSTICRLENAPRKTEAARLCAALIDQFGRCCVEQSSATEPGGVERCPLHVREPARCHYHLLRPALTHEKAPPKRGFLHRSSNPPLVPSATDCVGRIFRRRAAEAGG
jgi:Transposase DDE domain group 1